MPLEVSSHIKLFADDINIYRRMIVNQDDVGLQANIVALGEWCQKWMLSLNVVTCKVMHIGHHNQNMTYTTD